MGAGDVVNLLSDLAVEWVRFRLKAGLISARSASNHRVHLGYFVRAHPASGVVRVDRRSVSRWLESIGHLSPNTRRNHVATIRGFLRWAAAEGWMKPKVVDLIPRVRPPRSVPRALSTTQIHLLLGGLATERLMVMVALMLWAGLRCAEVADLHAEDVDEHAGTMLLKGKGGHERIVCIPTELAPILGRWLDRRGRVPGPFVTGRRGGLRPSTVSAMVAKAMTDAGVKLRAHDGRSAHALRHTAASDVLDRGASITTVQQMLGHVNVSTTAVYLRRARLEDLRQAMNGRDYAAPAS